MKDLSGEKYGIISVLSFDKKNGKHYYWNCICECGNEVKMRSDILKKAKSCGCINRGNELLKERVFSHGMCDTPEYQAWEDMKARCYNSGYHNFHRWGGRGIIVCDRWKNSFNFFFEDMGLRPSPKHSLDRYPNKNGNYEPDNCRWATRHQQDRNTSRNVWIKYEGREMILTDWATELGVNYTSLRCYIKRHDIETSFKNIKNGIFRKRSRNGGASPSFS